MFVTFIYLGVEMSSDEDTTPSLEKDNKNNVSNPSGLRQRFKLFGQKNQTKEGTINSTYLRDICSVNSGIERPLPSDCIDDVESGVDVLEENNFSLNSQIVLEENRILEEITEQIDNIEIDDEHVLNVRELNGFEAKEKFNDKENSTVTLFAPVGFVDMRDHTERTAPNYR